MRSFFHKYFIDFLCIYTKLICGGREWLRAYIDLVPAVRGLLDMFPDTFFNSFFNSFLIPFLILFLKNSPDNCFLLGVKKSRIILLGHTLSPSFNNKDSLWQ